jgi:thioredoxin
MDDLTLQQRIKEAGLPVVVEFWAPWCIPCRSIKPVVERLSQQFAGRVEVWEVNADEQPGQAAELHVWGVPTLIAYRGGEEQARLTGTQSPAALEALFASLASGGAIARPGMTRLTRLLRLGSGFALAAAGLAFGPQWLLVLLGLGLAFTGWYDRCPVWKAVKSRLFPALTPGG